MMPKPRYDMNYINYIMFRFVLFLLLLSGTKHSIIIIIIIIIMGP